MRIRNRFVGRLLAHGPVVDSLALTYFSRLRSTGSVMVRTGEGEPKGHVKEQSGIIFDSEILGGERQDVYGRT